MQAGQEPLGFTGKQHNLMLRNTEEDFEHLDLLVVDGVEQVDGKDCEQDFEDIAAGQDDALTDDVALNLIATGD